MGIGFWVLLVDKAIEEAALAAFILERIDKQWPPKPANDYVCPITCAFACNI
jgi:hypothetical protein